MYLVYLVTDVATFSHWARSELGARLSRRCIQAAVSDELLRRFNDFRSKTAKKEECYHRLSANCEHYVKRKFCVCDQLTKSLVVNRNGKPVGPQTFEEPSSKSVQETWARKVRQHLNQESPCFMDMFGVPNSHVVFDGMSGTCNRAVRDTRDKQAETRWKLWP